MSLINDALRRAKAVQQKTPASTHTELRFLPVDCSVAPRRSHTGWYYVVAIVCVTTAGFVAFHFAGEKQALQPTQVQARQSTPAIEPPPRGAPASRPQPVDKSTEYTQSKSPPPSTAPPTPIALASDPVTVQTNQPPETVAVVAVPMPPKPAEPRLQAIFFTPPHSSAMINGKTFFVGDKVGEFKLTAVDQATATLVGSGKTNILALP